MAVRRNVVFGLLLVILLSCGCGYRLRGSGSLGEGLSTIAIVPFANETFENHLESYLYDALVDEFSRSRNLRLVSVENADVLVKGSIKAVEDCAISYSPDDKTYEYRVLLRLDAEAVETRAGEVLWRRAGLHEVEEYKTSNEPLTVDRRKQAALRQLCRILAENIHDGLFTDF
ncbi:MAG: LptE family protein [Deltaproteobacteria bacterium]|nr:LptE family protein [Deltaproteobacteria bacterium]